MYLTFPDKDRYIILRGLIRYDMFMILPPYGNQFFIRVLYEKNGELDCIKFTDKTDAIYTGWNRGHWEIYGTYKSFGEVISIFPDLINISI